ncbi:hypothetical protein [Nocardia sp. NRRL WC-3656]|uniref:hypothetical protein n=1 Tax=Nocardia sp. NRRL WC-3656 TaxID=1463824 RepID=UPI00056467B7|nr:hypothetical protein [Nocardia sp. NRRL WC-3656]
MPFNIYVDGRRRQSSETFDDPAEATRWAALLERVGVEEALKILDVQRGTHVEYLTLTEWLRRYADTLTGIEPETRKRYHRYIDRDIADFMGYLPLGAITAETDKSWVVHLEEEVGNKPKTIANKHGFLSAAMSAAAAVRPTPLIAYNPCADTRLPRNDAPEPDYFDDAEWELFEQLMPPRWRAHAEFALMSMARPSEVTALRVGDINRRTGAVRITKAWKWAGGTLKLGKPKSSRGIRTVNVPLETLDRLDLNRPRDQLLFHTATGNPISVTYFYKKAWLPALGPPGTSRSPPPTNATATSTAGPANPPPTSSACICHACETPACAPSPDRPRFISSTDMKCNETKWNSMPQPIDLHARKRSTRTGCGYPGCTAEPEAATRRPGRPFAYCADPDHNAQTALRAKRKHAQQQTREPATPSLRPVTDGAMTVAGLLSEAARLRDELSAIVSDSADMLATITGAEAIDREIADIRREAAVKIAAAEQAQSAAERALAEMTAQRDRAAELETLALQAADEAAAQASQARLESDQARTDAGARIAGAEKDRDSVYTEAEQALATMRREYDAARTAQARAEAEADVIRGQAQAAAEENAALRRQLAEQADRQRQQIEAREREHSRAIAAAHAMADRAAREQRRQIDSILRAHQPSAVAAADVAEAE